MCPNYFSGSSGSYSYLCYPGTVFGWFLAGDIFLSQARDNHMDGANFLFFDSHVEHQPFMGSLAAYRNKWAWQGQE